jgi:predicted RNA-binding Zn-ribbon protein involved in translation (DUF1610 family)
MTKIEDIISKKAKDLVALEGMTKQMAEQFVKTISENIEIVEEEVVKSDESVVEKTEDEEEKYYECPNCGARIDETMQQCASCGVELEFKEEDEEEESGEG